MKNAAKTLRLILMTATSYMIPFVVAGGILFAVSIMLNGGSVGSDKRLARPAQSDRFRGTRAVHTGSRRLHRVQYSG